MDRPQAGIGLVRRVAVELVVFGAALAERFVDPGRGVSIVLLHGADESLAFDADAAAKLDQGIGPLQIAVGDVALEFARSGARMHQADAVVANEAAVAE